MSQAAALEVFSVDNYAPEPSAITPVDSESRFQEVLYAAAEELNAGETGVAEPVTTETARENAGSGDVQTQAEQSNEVEDAGGSATTEEATEKAGEGDVKSQAGREDEGSLAERAAEEKPETVAEGTSEAMMVLGSASLAVVERGAGVGGGSAEGAAVSAASSDAGQASGEAVANGAGDVPVSRSSQGVEVATGLAGEPAAADGGASDADKVVVNDAPKDAGVAARVSSEPTTTAAAETEVVEWESVESREAGVSGEVAREAKQTAANVGEKLAHASESPAAGEQQVSTQSGPDQEGGARQRYGNMPRQGQAGNSDGTLGVGGAEKTNTVNAVVGGADPDSSAADMTENSERIVRAARVAISRGSARIEIRLEPPELGSLRIEIKQNAAGLTLELQAGNSRAQQLLQRNVSQLHQMLEANGLPTSQINVQLRSELQDGQLLDQDQGGEAFADQSEERSSASEDAQSEDHASARYGADYQDDETQDSAGDLLENGVAAPGGWRELQFTSVDVSV